MPVSLCVPGPRAERRGREAAPAHSAGGATACPAADGLPVAPVVPLSVACGFRRWGQWSAAAWRSRLSRGLGAQPWPCFLTHVPSVRSPGWGRTETQPGPAGAEDGPEQGGHREPRDRRAGHRAVRASRAARRPARRRLRLCPCGKYNVCLRAVAETRYFFFFFRECPASTGLHRENVRVVLFKSHKATPNS